MIKRGSGKEVWKIIASVIWRRLMRNKENEMRTIDFKRNIELEQLLGEINSDIAMAEKNLLKKNIREYPVVFIMGAMRSGTTLLEQWMADMNVFAYPSNIMSRFFGAPIIGGKIQKLLTDEKYNFRDEIIDFSLNREIIFESSNGKTKGALQPNEFWYFWRRFLPEDLRGYTSEDLYEKVDIQTMRRELWGIAQVFDKPIVLKGMICNYHIPFLNKVFDKALFICLQRNIESHVKSVIKARERQYGTQNKWYSFLIPEYESLSKIEDIEVQVRCQIEAINNAVVNGLKNVPDQKKIQVKYEEFCLNPKKLYHEICEKLQEQGYIIEKSYIGKENFTIKSIN